ncbi:MAG: hypothetical protein ABR526_00020 [Chthoniobacterales bacterium]
MTETERSGAFRLAVLNPGGRDAEQDFSAGVPHTAAHAPVNFHAYAACTGGVFFRDTKRAASAGMPVLLMLRGDFRESERALAALHEAGRTVAVSLKETGLHQIADQLSDRAKLRRFLAIVRAADGCIASTPEAADVFRAARGTDESVAFIPTPYPLHDAAWDFSRPISERRGIFVGTREFDVPSRNHLAALLLAKELNATTGARVTVYNCDGRKGERLLAQLGFAPGALCVLPRGVGYAEYLRVVAEHRIVLEMDTSFVPGQVAGDALLCRLPCVGGNGAVDRLGHPTTCGAGRDGNELVELARRLLRDGEFYATAILESQHAATERLSFAGIGGELQQFYTTFASRP